MKLQIYFLLLWHTWCSWHHFQENRLEHFSLLPNLCYMHLEVTGPLAVKYDLARLSNLTMLSVTPRCSDTWCHYLFSLATEVQFN